MPSGYSSLPLQPTVYLHVKSGSAAQRLTGVLLLTLGGVALQVNLDLFSGPEIVMAGRRA